MKTVTIPADGEWHRLPDQPIRDIIAPTLGCEIDLLPSGAGRVRADSFDGRRDSVDVSYTVAEPYAVPVGALIDPNDPPELRPENKDKWHG